MRAESKEEIKVQPTQGTTPEAKRRRSKCQQEARCEALPIEDGPLPHWPIPCLNEGAAHQAAFLPVLPALETPAENLVGRGAKRDRERKGPVPDPGPLCRRALQPAAACIPSPPRTRGGWSQPLLRKTHRARLRSANSGSGEEGKRSRMWGRPSFVLSLVFPVISLVRITSSWDRSGRRAKGSFATSRLRTGNGQCVLRHDLHWSHAINDKTKNQKKKTS